MDKFYLTIGITLILFSMIPDVDCQNRAPSCSLNYQDVGQGDIILNTIRVTEPSPMNTYYCALQWNAGMDAGGYCGIQEHPDGRNFIFSIWDPMTVHDKIHAEYIGDGTQIANFGGEGTGLKSMNFTIGWITNNWYSFVSRVWNSNSHSLFGFWIYDHSNNIWHHLVTMDFPVNNIKFNTRTISFIEDWRGNGQFKREIHQKNGWKRKLNNEWIPFTSAILTRNSPDPGCANYINNYDGGVDSNAYYFIKSGSNSTSPVTNASGTMIYLPNTKTKPVFPIAEISNLQIINKLDSLELQWSVNSSKSPQFSFMVEIYNNSSFNGSPVINYGEIKPQARKTKIRVNNLPSGTYFYKLYIYDIFGNRSNELIK